MTTYLAVWAICCTVACFVITATVVGLEVRDYRRSKAGRFVAAKQPVPPPRPSIPAQRAPSAAVIVEVTGPQSFEDFLLELILTPHLEDVLA